MNKKLLTTLLLCIFTFEPICWAEEIIIGADGQARYANQETPVIKKQEQLNLEKAKMSNSNKEPLSTTTNQTDAILQKIEETQGSVWYSYATKLDEKYKNIVAKAPKTYTFNKSNVITQDMKNIVRADLSGGNYVLWLPTNKLEQFATEYNSDGSLMGFIKINLGSSPSVYYEYRVTSPNDLQGKLTHVMLCNHSKTLYSTDIYIYTAEAKLRMALLDRHLYEYDGLCPPSLFASDLKFDKSISERIGNFFWGHDGDSGTSEALTYTMYSLYDGPLFLIVAPIMLVGAILSPVLMLITYPLQPSHRNDAIVVKSTLDPRFPQLILNTIKLK